MKKNMNPPQRSLFKVVVMLWEAVAGVKTVESQGTANLLGRFEDKVENQAQDANEDGTQDRSSEAAYGEAFHQRSGPVEHQAIDDKVKQTQRQEGDGQSKKLQHGAYEGVQIPSTAAAIGCGRLAARIPE
jgi:hypothetical protein